MMDMARRIWQDSTRVPEVKVKVHPRTGHECPLGDRGVAILFFLILVLEKGNLMFFWPCIMNWLYINYQLLCTDYYLFIKY